MRRWLLRWRRGSIRLRRAWQRSEAYVPSTLVLAIFVAARLFFPAPFDAFAVRVFDLYQRILPRSPDTVAVAIVTIDQESLEQEGQWPWRRDRVAALVDAIGRQRPRAIGIDLPFPEPDRASPQAIADAQAGLPEPMRDALRALPSTDRLLAEAMARYPVALAVVLEDPGAEPPAGAPPAEPGRVANARGDVKPALPAFGELVTSIPEIDAATRRGVINYLPEPDAIVRRVPTLFRVGDAMLPCLACEVLRLGTRSVTISAEGDRAGVDAVQIGTVRIPTERDGRAWLWYGPHDERRFIPAAWLLAGKVAPGTLRDLFVLVGFEGTGLIDKRATPLQPDMLGVEIHAQFIEAALAGELAFRPEWLPITEVLLALLLGTLMASTVPRLKPWVSLALLPAVAVPLAGGGLLAFGLVRVLIDVATPMLATGLCFVASLGTTLLASERRRRQAEAALQRTAGELDAARRIQMTMLPRKVPEVSAHRDIQVHASIEPARAVGGDLYDYAILEGDRLFFMIGDVTGKGIPAALFMALSKALYKSAALRPGSSVDAIMCEANREISRENAAQLFITVAAGILDLATGDLTLCNAGHEPPLLLRPGQPPARLPVAPGPPLCSLDDFPYPATAHRLERGDAIVLVTDGVTEAVNPAGELYGAPRLSAAIAQATVSAGAEAIAETLLADLRLFVAGAEQADDITVLTVYRTAEA